MCPEFEKDLRFTNNREPKEFYPKMHAGLGQTFLATSENKGADEIDHPGHSEEALDIIQDRIEEAQAAGYQKALKENEERLKREREELLNNLRSEFDEIVDAMQTFSAEKEPFFLPIRELALRLGEEIAGFALSSWELDLNEILENTLSGLSLPLSTDWELRLSPSWASRIDESSLSAVFEACKIVSDHNLTDGDVQVRLPDQVIEILVEDKVRHLREQFEKVDFRGMQQSGGSEESAKESKLAKIPAEGSSESSVMDIVSKPEDSSATLSKSDEDEP